MPDYSLEASETPAGQLMLDVLQVEDLPALMEIETRSFSMPWSANTYRHEILSNPMAFYFVVRPPRRETAADGSDAPDAESPESATSESDTPAAATALPADRGDRHIAPYGALLAYGGFWLAGDEAHIVTIASHPDLRGRKLGETMLLYLLQEAQSLGASTVTLEVRPSNTPAIGLYAKWGFREEGRRKEYYRDNYEDALIYTLYDLDNPMTYLPIVLALGVNVTSPDLPT